MKEAKDKANKDKDRETVVDAEPEVENGAAAVSVMTNGSGKALNIETLKDMKMTL